MTRAPENCMLLGGLFHLYTKYGAGEETYLKLHKELYRHKTPKIQGIKNVVSVVRIERNTLETYLDRDARIFNIPDLFPLSDAIENNTLDKLLTLHKNMISEIEKDEKKQISVCNTSSSRYNLNLSNLMIYRTKTHRLLTKKVDVENILNGPFTKWVENIEHLAKITKLNSSYVIPKNFEWIYTNEHFFKLSKETKSFDSIDLIYKWYDSIDAVNQKLSSKLQDHQNRKIQIQFGSFYDELAKIKARDKNEYMNLAIEHFKDAQSLSTKGSAVHNFLSKKINYLKNKSRTNGFNYINEPLRQNYFSKQIS